MDTSYDERSWWDARYSSGGTSGPGSAGQEAAWKVSQILAACKHRKIRTVLDLGCGDGAVGRAVLAGLPGVTYLGIDQAPAALELCRASAPKGAEYAEGDLCGEGLPRADLVLFLDVLFHLQGQNRHDKAVANTCAAFKSLAVVAAWNEEIISLTGGRFAAHNGYRPLCLPGSVRDRETQLPMSPGKSLHVLTRRRA